MASGAFGIFRSLAKLQKSTFPWALRMQTRSLSLQEYQSKQLMQDYGINIQVQLEYLLQFAALPIFYRFTVIFFSLQRFQVVGAKEEVGKAVKDLNKQCGKVKEYVIKAQILAGGRGKGTFKESGFKGGVKLTTKEEEVSQFISKMLGYKLVTHQTTEDGVKVQRVMIAEALVRAAFYHTFPQLIV